MNELFLFLEPGSDPAMDRTAIEHRSGTTLLVWVPDGETAAKTASELVDGGVELVELYRGFDLGSAAKVIEAVVPRAPVAPSGYGFGASPAAGTKIRRSATIYDNPEIEQRVLQEHDEGWTAVVGTSLERMTEVAKELVDQGAELIEICGGTPLTAAARVREAIGGKVPVSLVAWPVESLQGAAAFNSASEAAHKS
jgi:hypothetical protein